MNVGDRLPLPWYDPVELVRVNRMRGQLRRLASTPSTNLMANQGRKILAGHAESAARRACPVEQAKAHLRRRGWKVFAATVIGGPDGMFVIGSGSGFYTEAEMLAFARRRGWEGVR